MYFQTGHSVLFVKSGLKHLTATERKFSVAFLPEDM